MQFFVKNRCYVLYLLMFFIFLFAEAMLSYFSLDAMSCASSFILQKKSNADSVIIKEHVLINPINIHKMTMVSMLREYGGWQMADYLVENIPKAMQETLNEYSFLPESKLAVDSINKKIKKSPDKNVHNTAATALIAVFTGDDHLWIANVGSCHAVIFSKYKKKSCLTFLNEPHTSKVSGLPVSHVFGYPELLLGISKDTNYRDVFEPNPDIISYAIKENDKLLFLASCEVFDILSQKEVKDICQNTSDPKGVCYAIKTAMQNALDKKNITIANVALYVVNLPMQQVCDVLMHLDGICDALLKVAQEKVDNNNEKVMSMKKIFKRFEVFLSSMHISRIESKKPIGDKVFAVLKLWYYKIQLGQYSDSAMSQKLTKEIDRCFDHLLAAAQVSDIGTFLSNKQKEKILLWRSQFNPDYCN